MSKIACKICPECGSVNKLDDDYCLCSMDLTNVRGELVNSEELDADEVESLSGGEKIYIQKCKLCGLEYVTNEKMLPVNLCHSCGGRMTGRMEYQEEKTEEKELSDEPVSKREAVVDTVNPMVREASPKNHPSEEDDEEDDNDSSNPFEAMLSDVRKIVAPASQNKPKVNEKTITSDEDEELDWPDDIKQFGTHKDNAEKVKKHDLVLTCTTNKNISYTIECFEGMEYRIGLEHNMKDFLKDDRISRNHCHFVYRAGVWSVVDHSLNGTFVNQKDIGENGSRVIHEGDILTLGHFADSVSFVITRKL